MDDPIAHSDFERRPILRIKSSQCVHVGSGLSYDSVSSAGHAATIATTFSFQSLSTSTHSLSLRETQSYVEMPPDQWRRIMTLTLLTVWRSDFMEGHSATSAVHRRQLREQAARQRND
jgi:hypothetical protein